MDERKRLVGNPGQCTPHGIRTRVVPWRCLGLGPGKPGLGNREVRPRGLVGRVETKGLSKLAQSLWQLSQLRQDHTQIEVGPCAAGGLRKTLYGADERCGGVCHPALLRANDAQVVGADTVERR